MDNNKQTTQEPIVSGEGSSKKHSGLRDFLSFAGVLLTAAVLALLLISFVFRSYAVDGPSMETALQNQDKLIIWKVPRTIASITGNDYIPGRGDVVVFTEDNLGACGQDGSRQLIKRVIGLPGERVTVQDGHYVVYNAGNPAGFDPDRTQEYDNDKHIEVTTGSIDVTLGENQLFVSGDNRPDSCDSRAFGPIEAKDVVGKLVVRLLPINKITIY
jgi:signal peptidase I